MYFDHKRRSRTHVDDGDLGSPDRVTPSADPSGDPAAVAYSMRSDTIVVVGERIRSDPTLWDTGYFVPVGGAYGGETAEQGETKEVARGSGINSTVCRLLMERWWALLSEYEEAVAALDDPVDATLTPEQAADVILTRNNRVDALAEDIAMAVAEMERRECSGREQFFRVPGSGGDIPGELGPDWDE
jgi:hypothetical protein